MPLFLSGQILREAVERLSVAAVGANLADYLIVKRALVNAQSMARAQRKELPSAIVSGLRAEPFVRAIQEMTSRVPPGTDIDSQPNPYFVPFGSRRDKTLGYRSAKFPSNGTSDTVSRWGSSAISPIAVVRGTKPKAFQFVARSREELEEFFVVRSAHEHFSGEKPRLLDTAVWWFRFTNLADRFGREPNATELVAALKQDLDLSTVETSALFDDPNLRTGRESLRLAV